MWWLSSLFSVIVIQIAIPVFCQNFNVLPHLLRPYLNEFPEIQTLNLLGNVSDMLFTNAKNEAGVHIGSYLYKNEYDFIIVGSGPAGCVLANRLSENPAWDVLLIEAGQPESVIQSIPLATTLTSSSKYVRKYYFERDPGACLNIEDKECPYATGVGLGGSTVVNNLIYTRGTARDYDNWDIEGWKYDDVLPYFEKMEKRRLADGVKSAFSNGPLNVENPRYTTGLLPFYLRAGQELGQNVIDYNGNSQLGIGIGQGTTLRGRRVSAASAYIHSIYKDRPNLHIYTNTLVTKILIDPETSAAYGVDLEEDGYRRNITARKEVILSAGAIGSAHLLMLSGVGSKKVLEKVKIPVIKELPVGQTFYTNIAVHAPTFLVNTTDLSIHIKRLSIQNVLQFNSGRGVLASLMGTEALSFIKTPFSDLHPSQPDVGLSFVSAGIQSDLGIGFRKVAQIKSDVYESYFKPIESPDLDTWSTIVMNLHSKTKGSLTLVDNNIATEPLLKYPYFNDTRDLDSIVYGIQQVIRFSQTKTMQSIGTKLHSIPLQSCSHFNMETDDYWRCYVRGMTQVAPQMIATNKMGQENDPDSVVDPSLRVRGIKNLRVADTSIIPKTISGHLQAVSYMIGEKLADMLKTDWKPISNDIPDDIPIDPRRAPPSTIEDDDQLGKEDWGDVL